MLEELRVHKIRGRYVLNTKVPVDRNGKFRRILGRPNDVLNSVDEVVKAVVYLEERKQIGRETTTIRYHPGFYPTEAHTLIRGCEGYKVLLSYD